jgi:hypothetical protein
MIHIRRVRLPESLQAFARRENGAVVVYVSAALPAGARAAAIRRALRAAPEAGWRSPRSPVELPALAGGAGLRLAPDGRWAYRALLAVAVAGVAAVIAVAATMALAGGPPPHGAAGSPAALRRPVAASAGPGPARPHSGPARGADRPAGAGLAPAPGAAGKRPAATRTVKPTTAGRQPTPGTSGTPTPVSTPSPTASPSPRPTASPTPSPTPTPVKKSGGSSGGCVTVLGVTICL